MAKQTNKDVIQVTVSDFHSGSNYALFLSKEWHGIKTSHIPRSVQVKIREHFCNFAETVKAMRKGKSVILVHNGDATDGDHHQSGDVCTQNEAEQKDIHIELMIEFQKKIGWERGDSLYYTEGTESHTKQIEHEIGKQLNAVPNGDFYAWNFLRLNTNGVESWYVHHGSTVAPGANEGNSQKNWMRNVQIDSMKNGKRPPDIIYSGHVHTPTYQTHTYRTGWNYKTMHYIITPSWQVKTRYAWMKAPLSQNVIGGVAHEIKADGVITTPKFIIAECLA